MKWVTTESFKPEESSFFMWYDCRKKVVGLGIYKDGKYLVEGGKELVNKPTHLLEGFDPPALTEPEDELNIINITATSYESRAKKANGNKR